MVQQITQGIKISVKTNYQGSFIKNEFSQHAFSYTITIENQSKHTVQLISRKWQIKDSLNHPTEVEGEGIVGQQPILLSGEKHSYSSGCLLKSGMGSMRGYYTFINFTTKELFQVPIPLFNLDATFSKN